MDITHNTQFRLGEEVYCCEDGILVYGKVVGIHYKDNGLNYIIKDYISNSEVHRCEGSLSKDRKWFFIKLDTFLGLCRDKPENKF